MSGLQSLKLFINQRLTAAVEDIFGHFERTITEYEEEMDRRHRKLLAVGLTPEIQLQTEADVQQLLVKEEVPPEQQEWSSSLDQQDPEPPPHINEEQEELWSSQEGKQLQGLEEADITKFTFTPVPVTSAEKPQSSQLHQRGTEHMETGADGEDCGGPEPARNSDPETHLHPDTENKTGHASGPDDSEDWKETREPQSGLNSLGNEEVPVSDSRLSAGEKPFSCLVCDRRFDWRFQVKTHKCVGQFSQLQRQTDHMETGAHGEDCGRLEPARNLDPETHLQPDTEDKTGDSSDTDDSDDWKETREPQSGLNSLGNEEVPISDSRSSAGEKPFSCSQCGKRFGSKRNLNRHILTHTGEKPYGRSVYKKSFTHSGSLPKHMIILTGEKPFSCSVCNKIFTWRFQVKTHKCDVPQSSKFPQTQTEETREAEPPTSSSTEHMETGADGEDCGGPEPARNSDPEKYLHPDAENKTRESSGPSDTDDSDDWNGTIEPLSV